MKKYLLLLLLLMAAMIALSGHTAVSYYSQFSCTLPAGTACGELHTNVAYMSTTVLSSSPSSALVCAGYVKGQTGECINVHVGSGATFTSDFPTSIYSFYGNIEQSYTINSTNRDFWCNCA
jgi:hypothetical protein